MSVVLVELQVTLKSHSTIFFFFLNMFDNFTASRVIVSFLALCHAVLKR